jgi:hypothetical protein
VLVYLIFVVSVCVSSLVWICFWIECLPNV